MKRENVDRLFMRADLPGEIPPGWSLIEILDNRRVLIENQSGVNSYDPSNIQVKVKQGTISVVGENLEIRQISRVQLVITGTIHGVSLLEWR